MSGGRFDYFQHRYEWDEAFNYCEKGNNILGKWSRYMVEMINIGKNYKMNNIRYFIMKTAGFSYKGIEIRK